MKITRITDKKTADRFLDCAREIYKNDKNDVPSCGAGILGVGLLYDAAGSDRYSGTIFSQGAALLGCGVLFDKDGVDEYRAQISAQGAAYFGIGLAIDAAGDDNYYLFGEGQGFGGVGGGVGVLADYAGDDVYTAEPSSDVFDRGDYHSEFAINSNQAQGSAAGRRGDGTDGHSWAGGLGVIADAFGDDTYTSGNWSLGCGYWFATGICYDGDGDDTYSSVYFTQASGAHFCNGALIDEKGNDRHILSETAGAAFGFGWDYTNALFVDRAGDDEYSANRISFATAQIRSFAFFFDMAGADTYTFVKNGEGFGAATFRENYAAPSELLTYYYYSKSAAIFIDANGSDNYFVAEDGQISAAEKWRNNATWRSPAADDANFGHGNFGIGLDRSGGYIPELEIFDSLNKE